jgi:hypothetical protein
MVTHRIHLRHFRVAEPVLALELLLALGMNTSNPAAEIAAVLVIRLEPVSQIVRLRTRGGFGDMLEPFQAAGLGFGLFSRVKGIRRGEGFGVAVRVAVIVSVVLAGGLVAISHHG